VLRSVSAVLVAPLLLLVACSDNNPASPSGGGGGGNPVYTVQLLPSNEVPPVSNADSTGTGTATVTLNLTKDASGAITAATADFQVTVSGFPANSTLVGAHIHGGAAGANGSVLVSTGLSGGNSVALTDGSGSFSRTGITVDPTVAQAIVNNPAAYYFNIHTSLNPSGAARGQL
jgi:hypothetical protein